MKLTLYHFAIQLCMDWFIVSVWYLNILDKKYTCIPDESLAQKYLRNFQRVSDNELDWTCKSYRIDILMMVVQESYKLWIILYNTVKVYCLEDRVIQVSCIRTLKALGCFRIRWYKFIRVANSTFLYVIKCIMLNLNTTTIGVYNVFLLWCTLFWFHYKLNHLILLMLRSNWLLTKFHSLECISLQDLIKIGWSFSFVNTKFKRRRKKKKRQHNREIENINIVFNLIKKSRIKPWSSLKDRIKVCFSRFWI